MIFEYLNNEKISTQILDNVNLVNNVNNLSIHWQSGLSKLYTKNLRFRIGLSGRSISLPFSYSLRTSVFYNFTLLENVIFFIEFDHIVFD